MIVSSRRWNAGMQNIEIAGVFVVSAAVEIYFHSTSIIVDVLRAFDSRSFLDWTHRLVSEKRNNYCQPLSAANAGPFEEIRLRYFCVRVLCHIW